MRHSLSSPVCYQKLRVFPHLAGLVLGWVTDEHKLKKKNHAFWFLSSITFVSGWWLPNWLLSDDDELQNQ